jgi:cytochrome b561
MLRTDGDPELLDFDPVTRFLHWLTLFLVATIFVLALTLGRLVWRQFARFPNWPADMPQAHRRRSGIDCLVCLARTARRRGSGRELPGDA